MPYTKPSASMSVSQGDMTYVIEIRIDNYAFWSWASVSDTVNGGLLASAWRPTQRWASKVAFRRAIAAIGLPQLITMVPLSTVIGSTPRIR